MNSDRTNDEMMYNIKSTYFVDKYSKQIPILVIFKLYIDLLSSEKVLRFFSLINSTER